MRAQLHNILWDSDCAFPLCQYLMRVAFHPQPPAPAVMLPATLVVRILGFLYEKGAAQLYIKSDEAFARSVVLGDQIRQAERIVFCPVQRTCARVCICV